MLSRRDVARVENFERHQVWGPGRIFIIGIEFQTLSLATIHFHSEAQIISASLAARTQLGPWGRT